MQQEDCSAVIINPRWISSAVLQRNLFLSWFHPHHCTGNILLPEEVWKREDHARNGQVQSGFLPIIFFGQGTGDVMSLLRPRHQIPKGYYRDCCTIEGELYSACSHGFYVFAGFIQETGLAKSSTMQRGKNGKLSGGGNS